MQKDKNNDENKKNIKSVERMTRDISKSESESARMDVELVVVIGLLFVVAVSSFVITTSVTSNLLLSLAVCLASVFVFILSWRITKRIGTMSTMLAVVIELIAVMNTHLPMLFKAIEDAILDEKDDNQA